MKKILLLLIAVALNAWGATFDPTQPYATTTNACGQTYKLQSSHFFDGNNVDQGTSLPSCTQPAVPFPNGINTPNITNLTSNGCVQTTGGNGTLGVTTCGITSVAITDVTGLGTGVAAALGVNVGSAGAFVTSTNRNLGVTFTSGTSRTLANAAEIVVCTSTCTVTPPGTLTAGDQFCVQNDDNVSTVITLAAVANIQYEATARTSYGTANHTMTSGGAVKDQICMVAISTTKYNVFSSVGTWTNN